MIAKSPAYPTIISRLKTGDSLLDIGCLMGQDLRKLVFDGTPTAHLYGIDIVNFWDLGYELFRDAEKFNPKFIETDILNPNAALQALAGKIDIICINQVLHQWDRDTQVMACKQLCVLSKVGSLVVGLQIGSRLDEKDRGVAKFKGFGHNVETFRRMWDVVGKEMGMEWKCEADLKTWDEVEFDAEETAYLGEDACVLQFVVRRIS